MIKNIVFYSFLILMLAACFKNPVIEPNIKQLPAKVTWRGNQICIEIGDDYRWGNNSYEAFIFPASGDPFRIGFFTEGIEKCLKCTIEACSQFWGKMPPLIFRPERNQDKYVPSKNDNPT